MSAKLERLAQELDKARRRAAEWEAKVRDLEQRYQEAENTEIHQMVHAANLTPEQLGQLLRQAANMLPNPNAMPKEEEDEVE